MKLGEADYLTKKLVDFRKVKVVSDDISFGKAVQIIYWSLWISS